VARAPRAGPAQAAKVAKAAKAPKAPKAPKALAVNKAAWDLLGRVCAPRPRRLASPLR
jgi:hypothetical protein